MFCFVFYLVSYVDFQSTFPINSYVDFLEDKDFVSHLIP